MRNQDKALLTTSTRLLNARVKHAELKTRLEQASLSPTERIPMTSKAYSGFHSSKKAISTVDLLRQQKEIHKKMRRLSLDSGEGPDEDLGAGIND